MPWLVLGLWACSSDTDTDEGASGSDTDTNSVPGDTGPAAPAGLCPATLPNDLFTILGVSITGDTLTVNLNYPGGCEVHQVGVCWTTGVLEGPAPYLLQGTAFHDAMDDTCEGFVSDAIVVDLTPVRLQYADETGNPSGTITLEIANVGFVDYVF